MPGRSNAPNDIRTPLRDQAQREEGASSAVLIHQLEQPIYALSDPAGKVGPLRACYERLEGRSMEGLFDIYREQLTGHVILIFWIQMRAAGRAASLLARVDPRAPRDLARGGKTLCCNVFAGGLYNSKGTCTGPRQSDRAGDS
jgi:hypothetical protein